MIKEASWQRFGPVGIEAIGLVTHVTAAAEINEIATRKSSFALDLKSSNDSGHRRYGLLCEKWVGFSRSIPDRHIKCHGQSINSSSLKILSTYSSDFARISAFALAPHVL